jgi:hypothetical protein
MPNNNACGDHCFHGSETVGCVQWNPLDNMIQTWPPAPYAPPVQTVWFGPPTDCSGDVHVFPCARCNVCKCGKATLTKDATHA